MATDGRLGGETAGAGRERPAGEKPRTAEAKNGRAPPPKRRAPRRLIVLSMLIVFLLLGWCWVDRQLEPKRLAATVLGQAGKSLQLDLSFEGEPDYAFKPEPRLLVPKLTVRDPITQQVFLSAERAEVSLPWSSVTGDTAIITRIELERPVLDLPGLRAWQARRPPKPFELPTLTRGIEVRAGSVRDAGFSISELDLVVPRLQTGVPAEATASGRFTQGDTGVCLKLHAIVATPGLASRYSFSSSGVIERSPAPLEFKLQARGEYRRGDTDFSVTALPMQLEATSPLPSADGDLRLKLGERLEISFAGQLQDWPRDWPSLPAPLSQDTRQLPLRLDYLGARNLGDALSLQVDKSETHLETTLRIAELQAWAAQAAGSPLPPLTGRMRTPKIDLDGIELEGVQVEIRDEGPTP
jgi:hypothetical protein